MSNTTTLSFAIDPATAGRFKAHSRSQGLSASELLREAVEILLDGVDAPAPLSDDLKPAGAKKKITVRLPDDVVDALDLDARGHGVAPSMWAASILMAKFREAPQPTKPERVVIQKVFRQLFGMGTNINQMALAMNRGLIRGQSVVPALSELMKLRQQLEQFEDRLAEYAAGKFKVQMKGIGGDE